jgi:hypothetical protein
MAAIAKLIRNAPRDLLEAFFDAQECPLGKLLRSFGPDDDYAGPLLKAVDELSDQEHARLTAYADRVVGMTAELVRRRSSVSPKIGCWSRSWRTSMPAACGCS